MDTFKLVLRPPDPDLGSHEERVRYVVNDQDLVDIVRSAEISFAAREGDPSLAGGYEGLPYSVVAPPSTHLLGTPDPLYAYDSKIQVLVCSDCGEPGCWPLLVRVDVGEDVVTWSEFEQPHRTARNTRREPWHLRIGSYTFDRRSYERELSRLKRPNNQ